MQLNSGFDWNPGSEDVQKGAIIVKSGHGTGFQNIDFEMLHCVQNGKDLSFFRLLEQFHVVQKEGLEFKAPGLPFVAKFITVLFSD